MILKDKKLFFLGIFLIFGLIVSLSAVSAENIQDVSDTDLVSLGDEKIVLTDSGDESGGGDSGDNPGDNPAGDNPGDNPAGDNPGDNPAGGDDPGTGVSTKKETSLTVTAEPANVNQEAFIDITLKDSDEAEINANVIVNIDDEDKDVTIDNGIGRLTLSGLSIGSHHFTVTFAETDDYLGSTAQGTLEITKVKTAIVISADPVYVGDDALIDITLVDDENNMIDGEFKVTVNVNGEDKEVDITDGSGNLTLPNLGVNNYPISASFSGDDTYDGCEATGSLDVKKIPTTLTISAPAIIAGSNAVIKVTLKDKDGNNLDGTVVLTVNGKTYNVKTNVNGVASITFKLKEGKYKIVCKDLRTDYTKTCTVNVYGPIVGIKFNKYGVSEDGTMLLVVGRPSAVGEESKYGYTFYKTLFERTCPYCGGHNIYWSIFWAGNEYADGGIFPATGIYETGSAEGNIFCKDCDCDFSIFGNEHVWSNPMHLKILDGPHKSSKEEAYALKSGNYVLS